jgi:hypothetical protein
LHNVMLFRLGFYPYFLALKTAHRNLNTRHPGPSLYAL